MIVRVSLRAAIWLAEMVVFRTLTAVGQTLGPRLRRALVIPVALGVMSAMFGTARAEVAPPPELRMTWEFECHASDKGTTRIVITVNAIEDGTIVLAWEEDGKSSTKYMPLSTWPLAYTSREEASDHTRHRMVDWGSLDFRKLAVGEKVKAWVRQFDTRWGRNRWKWKAEIKDKTAVDMQGFGTLEVYVIEASIYSPEWGNGATIVNHYSPKMNMITFWKEHDSNERVEECHLVSRK